MKKLRAIVVGAGSFGANHVRVSSQLEDVELAAIGDSNRQRAGELAAQFHTAAFTDLDQVLAADAAGQIDAAIVVTPTRSHEAVATQLLRAGIDVLVEKPIASSGEEGERLTQLAAERSRILQVGHLERFNPAVIELERRVTVPLFFEVHRLSLFTPRSLDIDVVLDLMIHDLDIILTLTQEKPIEIRAAGISVLSKKVDIANVRLAFPSGCIANLTASRVSTEKVRKLRLFQPNQYTSLDYARQDAVAFSVNPKGDGAPDIGFGSLPVEKAEPLYLELGSFFTAVRTRSAPRVDGQQATEALRLAEDILAKIKEHGE